MRISLFLTFLCLAGVATAQDRNGNDTAGEWAPTHHKIFGLWDSACDHRDTVDRCYIRYVDVFSPAPKFGAVFLFITPEATGHKVEFGFERGIRYAETGFWVTRYGNTIWQLSDPCLRSQKCIFKDDKAADFLSALTTPNTQTATLHQDFTDRHGQKQHLKWDFDPFAEVLADFERETAARALRNP